MLPMFNIGYILGGLNLGATFNLKRNLGATYVTLVSRLIGIKFLSYLC
jgi:hypothetical protein